MKLSRVERWILSNQYRILEALYPDEAEHLSEDREALNAGYEMHYSGMIDYIYDDKYTLSAEQCREVLDVLSMFRAITYAYRDLKDKSGINEYDVKFAGFDGNEETTLVGYTRWFCNSDGGRFQELDRGDDFNSHAPMLQHYRAMLAEWNHSRDKNKLTKDDIIRITSARAR